MRDARRALRDRTRLFILIQREASIQTNALDAPVKVMDHGGPIGLCDAELDALPVGVGCGITGGMERYSWQWWI